MQIQYPQIAHLLHNGIRKLITYQNRMRRVPAYIFAIRKSFHICFTQIELMYVQLFIHHSNSGGFESTCLMILNGLKIGSSQR